MKRFGILILLLAGVTSGSLARVTPIGESLIPLAQRTVPGPVRHRSSVLDEHPNWRINSDHSGQLQNEEQACISPANAENFAAVWRDFRLGYRRVGVGYSTDAGLTWDDALFPQMYYPWQSDPLLVVDGDGNFTAMVISYDPGPDGEDGLLQVTSYDGGRTWRDSVWAAHATQPIGFEDKEMLTIDQSGSAYAGSYYCAWTHFYGPEPYDSTYIWLTFRRPGQSYSTPRVVSDHPSVQWPNVCVGLNGEVFVSWVAYWYPAIVFSRSTDGGSTWSDQQIVTETRIAAAEIAPDLLIFAYGVMAVDHSPSAHHGRLYLLFTDAAPDYTEADVWLIYSDNHGQSWSPRIRMDDEQESFPVDQFHPWLSVDEEGRVWVVFYDRRHDPNGILMDVYFTVSTDGGETWRPNERITTVSSDPSAGSLDAGLIGEYIGWDARGGKALAVWTDTRLGDQDAYGSLIDSVFVSDAAEERTSPTPSALSLTTFPNPTNGAATLLFTLESASVVSLNLYNTLGQVVRSDHLGRHAAGDHTHSLGLDGLTTGLYIAEVATGNHSARTKVMLIR